MIVTILIFVAILALLIFVHEFGHFIVAKKSGMQVDEFGFGFPPRLVGIQRLAGKFKFVWGHKPPADPTKTVYSINWIPLGGFVKIVGENNEEVQDPKSFVNKPFFNRLLTLLAGVLMNVILAWVLFSVGYMSGLPVAVDSNTKLPAGAHLREKQTGIIEIVADSPASKAGLQANDIIKSIDSKNFSDSEDLRSYILSNAGKDFDFEVRRGKSELHVQVPSQANPGEGSGPTGIVLAQVGKLSFPFHLAIWQGAKTTVTQIQEIAKGLYSLFSSGQGLSSLGGPVKIASLTGQVANMGFVYLIQFTAFLSLNLAILNVLPIPALDGGRILFLLIEKIRGKANNQKAEQIANTAGFFLLLLLMLVITVRDISRLISG